LKGEIKLSVKNELTTLKRTREDLEKRMAEICSTLDNLYAKRNSLVQKVETLKTRTSSLAQTLLEKVQDELEKLNKEISQVEKEQSEVKREIEENQQSISLREDDTTLYIKEQSSIMVSKFLEYIENHLEAIGEKIKTTFYIKGISFYKEDRHYGCYVPTGDIGICDESKEIVIAKSNDFYFENTLYTLTRDEYDALVCNPTEWYKVYRNRFILLLVETLEKNYTYSEFFKLTIGNSCFTLELV